MQDASPPQTPPPPRRLTRAGDDRVLAGVCGGLARYFNVDAVLFRVGAVALVLLGGAGLLLYLAAWLLVPADGDVGAGAGDPRRNRALAIVGVVLLVLALGALLSHGPFGWWPWPIGLVLVVGAVAWALAAAGGTSDDATRRILRVLAVLAASAVLAVAGAWLAGMDATAAGIVIVLGGAAVAAAALTGAGARWLILPALALALPASAVAAAGVDLHGGVGDRHYRPVTAAEVRQDYELGAGRLVVDLRDAHLPAGDRPLHLRVGAGEAVLLVPADTCVATRATLGAGLAETFDRSSGGVDLDWEDAPAAPANRPRILLDADVGLGRVAVGHDLDTVDGGRFPGLHDERNTGCSHAR
jgi:phage shock protein PspC (stress-responsive transcriptional regulator)